MSKTLLYWILGIGAVLAVIAIINATNKANAASQSVQTTADNANAMIGSASAATSGVFAEIGTAIGGVFTAIFGSGSL